MTPEKPIDSLATLPADASSVDETRTSETDGLAGRDAHYSTTAAITPGSTIRFHTRPPARYRIISEHGRGGLGCVSRAHDEELGRDIAIKELIARTNVNEVRFLREALITARLEHPGIVPVYEAGRWADGTPFYAMKLVAGRPLRELIAERATVEQRVGLLHHVIAVADAIAYAHGRNIIHRDLKPGNIIVGDFGETIVIDWGLAKDLTTTEASGTSGHAVPVASSSDLTSTGSVLGTPAYMAPEQERGEHVDQRADVFAIGAMLWELCSLQKVPPADKRQRKRMLLKAGIDRDLAIIIDKALSPDPVHRYPDAGALASDLKAFKAGARIAARSYSLLAMFAHWMRRHRALTLGAVAAITISIAAVVLYVQNIASERDRADSSEEVARRSQAATEASLDDLTLEHARLLLTSDPSAAIALLATYHGAGRDRAAQIRAEANGRGSAILRAKPHADRIQWVVGASDRSVISLSIDGMIVRTSLDQHSTVLATGVSPKGRLSFSPSRGLLAYGCDPTDVCILDVVRGVRLPLSPELRDWQLAGVAFSPSGTRLALLSYSGTVRVLDLSIPEHPVKLLEIQRNQGAAVLFVDDDTIAIGLLDPLGLDLVRLNGESQSLTIHDHFIWDASPAEHRLALATVQGYGLVLARDPLRITNKIALCHSTPTGLKLLPEQRRIAYSCEDGDVGIWDLDRGVTTLLVHMEGRTDRITISPSADYVLAAGGNGLLDVIDLSTKLISVYQGHGFNLTAISAPTAEFPYVISGDAHGALRVWPVPVRFARVSTNVHTRFASVMTSKADKAIIAATFRPELAVLSSLDDSRAASPHLMNATLLEASDSGRTFAAYGSNEFVEIWSTQQPARQRVIATDQGVVSHVAFIDQTDEFVTSGRDGRLVYRTPDGDAKQVIRLDQPISTFLLLPRTRDAVINTSDGSLWRADAHGRLTILHRAGVRIARMSIVHQTASIVIAYANGEITLLDTTSWRQATVRQLGQMVRDIAVVDNGSMVAVVDNDGAVHVGQLSAGASNLNLARWTSFPLSARGVALTSDGIAVAICTDGTVWFYSAVYKDWICLPTGTVDLTHIVLSGDGATATVFDTDGRVIRFDLVLIRELFKNAKH